MNIKEFAKTLSDDQRDFLFTHLLGNQTAGQWYAFVADLKFAVMFETQEKVKTCRLSILEIELIHSMDPVGAIDTFRERTHACAEDAMARIRAAYIAINGVDYMNPGVKG